MSRSLTTHQYQGISRERKPGQKMKGSGDVVAGTTTAEAPLPTQLDWKFSQVFGERTAGEEVQEVDIISAIEFDKSGDHLATGDRGGRVVLFERTDVRNHASRKDLEMDGDPIGRHPEFHYKTEFQSHEPEVQEKKVKKIAEMNIHASENGSIASSSTTTSTSYLPNGACAVIPHNHLSTDLSYPSGCSASLRLPVVTSQDTCLIARCRRIYAHAHDYHINSISNNSDGETFISADDLRINLWNLEISSQSFNIVDVKPANMEDLTEVITSAEFHPTHCNMLAYSSSKGSIRLIDLRQSALCDNHSKILDEREAPGSRSFFTEIITSISDIKFAKDGRYLLSRDYMTLKVHSPYYSRVICLVSLHLCNISRATVIFWHT
ncbi:hypothetical protein ZIOFF_058472 [Zingiber officinale]|uniref:Serine/threonine-protein phosphatase 2A 55 kDa regulatory subunit B n=1 Tax=Zingiber officinale TaxID=94328 RepID=A0A8J5KI80_ZINOF|nr:hypothetical protein ZIOFF_058472 [Zingiber officinale]